MNRFAPPSFSLLVTALLCSGTTVLAPAIARAEPSPVAAAPGSMTAVIHREYGSPAVLRLEQIARPTPGADEVLIKVHAAAINPVDWHRLTGTPYLMRFDSGMREPEDPRLGVDYAGTVVAVGGNVKRFKPGDEVFGARNGSLAEYIVARTDRAVAHKPPNVSFEQAAGVAVAGLTALQGLRDHGKLRAGQKVLINGASGGVGTFAVQIAKALGAEVTGVCSTRNVELVLSLGADRVVDYTKEDFTKRAERYDVILDNVGNHALGAYRRILEPQGIYVMVGGPKTSKFLGPLWQALKTKIYAPFVDQDFLFFISQMNPKDIEVLRDLMASGKVRPVVDRRYDLTRVADAFRYLETGRARGKIVIAVGRQGPS